MTTKRLKQLRAINYAVVKKRYNERMQKLKDLNLLNDFNNYCITKKIKNKKIALNAYIKRIEKIQKLDA